jgi:hypothetical protein
MFKKQFEKIMGVSLGSFTAYDKNGTFSCTTSRVVVFPQDKKEYQYEGVVFLTPDAPSDSGIAFASQTTGGKMVDHIANVYNRLVLFQTKVGHVHGPSFGTQPENGRLIQTFAFDLE